MKTRNILMGIVGIILCNSCARNHAVANIPVANPSVISDVLPEKTRWVDSIHNQDWMWMYGKYTTNFSDGTKKFTFKTSIKCTKDSAMNALISIASLPIFNAMATTDSLFFVNKKDRCFGKKSITSFKELLGVELSLKNIQELFLGLPLGYNQSIEYTDSLSAFGDSSYVRGLLAGDKTIGYCYASSVKTPRLAWQEITSKADATTARIQYLSWQRHKDLFVPSSFNVSIITPERNITVLFTYDKFELDLPQEIYIQIPDDYAPCK
ncbi:MAG: DUF4292 domain-containing protein [Flavobacteriales bacterium]